MASVATYKKTLVPFLERVFFFLTRSASPAFAASMSLVSLDSYSERFLRQPRQVSAHALIWLHMRVVSFFDAHALNTHHLRGASFDGSLAESLSECIGQLSPSRSTWNGYPHFAPVPRAVNR